MDKQQGCCFETGLSTDGPCRVLIHNVAGMNFQHVRQYEQHQRARCNLPGYTRNRRKQIDRDTAVFAEVLHQLMLFVAVRKPDRAFGLLPL